VCSKWHLRLEVATRLAAVEQVVAYSVAAEEALHLVKNRQLLLVSCNIEWFSVFVLCCSRNFFLFDSRFFFFEFRVIVFLFCFVLRWYGIIYSEKKNRNIH
jgi:hypothetical protein